MTTFVLTLINDSLSAASQWFLDLFTANKVYEVYFVFLFIYFAVKFLLAPILGRSRGSDKARSYTEGNSDG